MSGDIGELMNIPPRLVLTSGEPAGIGPDLCVMLAQDVHGAEIVLVGDPDLLTQRARMLDLSLQLEVFDPAATPELATAPGHLKVLPVPLAATVQPGQLNTANAPYVVEVLERAVKGCRSGVFDAVVTAPVHKGVINDAGIPFSGHTEFFAQHCGDFLPVMMLAAPGLRVALVTTHLPLRAVADAITPQRLEQVIRILHRDLNQRFAIVNPRILVCGLNPHAGENGHLGREELEVINPVLDSLRTQGMDLHGPLSADTVFTPHHLEHADAVLAMYHDQGLPVLKHMGFHRAVNITLGLPLIRTSVDHGTALDRAGTCRINSGSLKAAVNSAVEMVICSACDPYQ